MLRINQLKLDIEAGKDELEKAILAKLKIDKKQLIDFSIVKRSIDARKGDVKYVYCVEVNIDDEKRVVSRLHNKDVQIADRKKYSYRVTGTKELNKSPIIVGTGPAGLFCGYMLAKAGYMPILIERGHDADNRVKTVEKFWNEGILNGNSNVQFGEGGAGTFSDGKLNTLVKDSYGRGREVLETFVKFGAPEEILYDNKPHIGTDKLVDVVKNMRKEIINLGGKILFNTKMTDVEKKVVQSAANFLGSQMEL